MCHPRGLALRHSRERQTHLSREQQPHHLLDLLIEDLIPVWEIPAQKTAGMTGRVTTGMTDTTISGMNTFNHQALFCTDYTTC